MAETLIQWTDRVWNFLRGCTIISPGCKFCYAMKQAHRFNFPGGSYEGLTELGPSGPRWTGKIRIVEEKIAEPLHVRKPQRWFVNSMSDLFHEDVPDHIIDRAVVTMHWSPRHTYQILTKRPERMLEYSAGLARMSGQDRALRMIYSMYRGHPAEELVRDTCYVSTEFPWPLPNVWLGVSVENQEYADKRIPLLLQTPAAIRFVSYEPALGPVDFSKWLVLYGTSPISDFAGRKQIRIPPLDWIIVGGESGAKARAFNIQWAKDIVAQCKAAGVACFVKQLGANPILHRESTYHKEGPGMKVHIQQLEIDTTIRLKDSHGGDMSEWEPDLRVREFPETTLHRRGAFKAE